MFDVYFRSKWYPIGSHIRIKCPSGIYHHAIIVGGSIATLGPVMVVDNAKSSGVDCRSLEEVAGNDPVEIVARPQSHQHADAVVQRAFSQRGSSYDLFSKNCEHFATWCMSAVPQSHQLAFAVVMMLLTIGVVWAASNE